MADSEREALSPGRALRTYRPGDEQAIQAMYATVFGKQRSLEEWRWRFRDAPDGPALIHVLERDGRLVGHIAHVGFAVFVESRRLRLAHGSDTMVLPEARGRDGMPRLVRGFLESEHGFDLRMNFPTDRAAVAMERLGGGRRLGRIPRWVRWHTPHPALPQPGRFLIACRATRLHAAVASWPRPRIRVEPLAQLGPEVDELAEASAAFAPCIRVRDASYLRWRWLDRAGGSWTIRAARSRGGGLHGLVVFGSQESEHGRRGLIAEILVRDAAALRALLLDAAGTLTSNGCLSVACDYLDPRPWARRALYRSGFLPYGTGINVVCGSLSERAGGVPERLASWYLTRGDTDLA